MTNTQNAKDLRVKGERLLKWGQTLIDAANVLDQISGDMDEQDAPQLSATPATATHAPAVRTGRPPKVNTEGNQEHAKTLEELLKKNGRFMHRTEIEKQWSIKNLSSILSTAQRKGKYDIVGYRVGASLNNVVWGLKDWLKDPYVRQGDASNIKDQYMHNPEALRYS